MPIFDTPPRNGSLRPVDADMRAGTEALVARFRRAFAEIDFEIAWASDTVNARALFGQPRNKVVLYGGLVRHKAMGEEGLTLALAHEVGHLLGGKPRHPYHFWLSCEGVADYWATRHGIRRIWQGAERASRLRLGAHQLLKLQRSTLRGLPVSRRRRDGGGHYPCLVTLPPSCRWRTWMAGLRNEARPFCAC